MVERGEVDRQSGPAPSRLLRRPHGHQEHQGRPAGHDTRTASQSIKEREEDYHRARERIIGAAAEQGGGGGVPAEVVQSSSPAGSGSGSALGVQRGHSGGGGPGGYMAGRGGGRDGGGGGGRGRGRKAVFRDKDREMQDPDYTRRDGGPSSYGTDGMGYGMEVRGRGLVLCEV